MIVDSHVHLMPDRLAQAIRRFFDSHHPVDFAYPLDPATVLDSLHRSGVEEVWNLPYAHKAGVAEGLNRTTAKLCAGLAAHPVSVVLGCTAHPDDEDLGADLGLGHAVSALGARVLKLHCSVGGFAPDDRRLGALYEAAAGWAVPVVVHAGVSPTGRTAAADLAPLARAVARHPTTTFVLAHTGYPNQQAALDLMHRHTNLWSDLTPVLDEHLGASVEEIESVADRLLFGSDAPNTTLPVDRLAAWLVSLGLSTQSLEAIRRGNAQRLMARAASRTAAGRTRDGFPGHQPGQAVQPNTSDPSET